MAYYLLLLNEDNCFDGGDLDDLKFDTIGDAEEYLADYDIYEDVTALVLDVVTVYKKQDWKEVDDHDY